MIHNSQVRLFCFDLKDIHTCEFKVSVQGVVIGGHFATLCQKVDFYEAFSLLISKIKGKHFYTFNYSFSEKSSNRAT